MVYFVAMMALMAAFVRGPMAPKPVVVGVPWETRAWDAWKDSTAFWTEGEKLVEPGVTVV